MVPAQTATVYEATSTTQATKITTTITTTLIINNIRFYNQIVDEAQVQTCAHTWIKMKRAK
jgi:hypothetical protein